VSTPTRPRAPEPVLEEVYSALASTPRPPRPGRLAQCLTFGWRGMLKIKHVPEQLLDVTLTPVLFLVMFTYLFGGSVSGSTSEYLQYLLPGLLVQSVLFVSVYSGVSLNADVTKGVTDRFKSMPIWRPAPLIGAVLGDSARYVVAAFVVIVVGVIMGFDPESWPGVFAAVAVITVFAFAMSWIFTVVGLILRAQQAVLNAGFMGLFPLVFLSNIFVIPDTLPAVLEAFVGINPVSHLATAARGLIAGEASAWEIVRPLLEAVAIFAIFAPLTIRLYRRGR
jgi:ABC-2 type transport system permease protein